jgi:hypothetical protein
MRESTVKILKAIGIRRIDAAQALAILRNSAPAHNPATSVRAVFYRVV